MGGVDRNAARRQSSSNKADEEGSSEKNADEPFLREGNESGHSRPAGAFENPVTIKDGSERVIAWNSDRLTSINGDLTGLIACGQGVTEYKRLQG